MLINIDQFKCLRQIGFEKPKVFESPNLTPFLNCTSQAITSIIAKSQICSYSAIEKNH